MPLPKARIALLDEGDLLGVEFDASRRVFLLQCQPAFMARTHLVLDQNLLDGDVRQPPAFGHQQRLKPIAPIRRVR